MQRRQFLGGLFKGILAASVAPQVIVNATTKWKVSTTSGLWTPEQIALYQKLPYYLVKMQIEHIEVWQSWNMIYEKRAWTPNMGNVIRIPVPDYAKK